DLVTEWFPRYFPDRDGGDFIVSAYKAELVSAVLLSQAKFLRAVAEKYTVPFPMKPDYFNDLRPGHVCFVKYGYVTYYNYWSLTDQRADPPGLVVSRQVCKRRFPSRTGSFASSGVENQGCRSLRPRYGQLGHRLHAQIPPLHPPLVLLLLQDGADQP